MFEQDRSLLDAQITQSVPRMVPPRVDHRPTQILCLRGFPRKPLWLSQHKFSLFSEQIKGENMKEDVEKRRDVRSQESGRGC